MERSINVLGTELQPCGTDPMTGFFRDSYCNTSPADFGNHSVAAIVSDRWLTFSAQKGNDLRPILKDGCKWCLCASRWKESFDAWKKGDIEKECVPKVMLGATHQTALKGINLDDLKAFAVDKQSSSDPAQGGPIR